MSLNGPAQPKISCDLIFLMHHYLASIEPQRRGLKKSNGSSIDQKEKERENSHTFYFQRKTCNFINQKLNYNIRTVHHAEIH